MNIKNLKILILLFLNFAAVIFWLLFSSGIISFLFCVFILNILILVLVKSKIAKIVLVNTGAVILALIFFQCHINKTQTTVFGKASYSKNFFLKDSLLGYRLNKGRMKSEKIMNNLLVYATDYSINNQGFRVTPESTKKYSFLFFGGSYTFGEGVKDDESLPYLVSAKSGYKAYNFGVNGYGPHQMLRAVESGMVENIVNRLPRIAIYQSADFHLERSIGCAVWENFGPRYEISRNSQIVSKGNFNQFICSFRRAVNYIMPKHYDNYSIQLFTGIVKETERKLKLLYPGIEFHIIIYDVFQGPNHLKYMEALKKSGIEVHKISEIIPGLKYNDPNYFYLDSHPKPRLNRELSDYIISFSETLFGGDNADN